MTAPYSIGSVRRPQPRRFPSLRRQRRQVPAYISRAVFIALLFWGWLFGIVGRFLAAPLTATQIAALDVSSHSRPFAIMLGRKLKEEEPKKPRSRRTWQAGNRSRLSRLWREAQQPFASPVSGLSRQPLRSPLVGDKPPLASLWWSCESCRCGRPGSHPPTSGAGARVPSAQRSRRPPEPDPVARAEPALSEASVAIDEPAGQQGVVVG